MNEPLTIFQLVIIIQVQLSLTAGLDVIFCHTSLRVRKSKTRKSNSMTKQIHLIENTLPDVIKTDSRQHADHVNRMKAWQGAYECKLAES